jgi:hypothetical protein
MSMLSTLVSKKVPGGPGYDRFGFFRLPKAEVDPVVYQVAWDVTPGKSPAEILENCRTALRQSVRECTAAAPHWSDPGASPMTYKLRHPTVAAARRATHAEPAGGAGQLIRRRGGVGKNPPHDRCPERTQLSEPDSTARAARACSRIAGTNCRAGAGSPDSTSSTSSGVPT